MESLLSRYIMEAKNPIQVVLCHCGALAAKRNSVNLINDDTSTCKLEKSEREAERSR